MAQLQSNELLRDAVAAFNDSPGRSAAIDVLRQVIGSELLLDVTEAGGRPSVSIVEANGAPSLLAFTTQESLAAFRERTGRTAQPTSWPQRGEDLLEFVSRHGEAKYLYIDPAGPACALGREEIAFAVASAVNPRLKAAAVRQSLVDVVSELEAPGARVVLADAKGSQGPMVLAGPEGQPILPVFSTGVEVAAFDASLKFREADADWVLQTVRRHPERALLVDPAGPSVLVRHGDL